jgi:hypothetical protein
LFGYDGKQCSAKTGYECTDPSQSIYGMASSTTGNIYGIYDMNGGSWEYTMAMYRPTDGTSVTDNSGFNAGTSIGDLSTIDEKYWDRYTTDTTSTTCGEGMCYGSALSETEYWYNDFGNLTSNVFPWSMRGGSYENAVNAGAFAFTREEGDAIETCSFRIIQVKQ